MGHHRPHREKGGLRPARPLIVPDRDAVEMDEMCVSRKRNLWLWTAVSRATGQILAYVLGDRSYGHVDRLVAALPEPWRRRRIYTDGYGAYGDRIASWRHRVCDKGEGLTSRAEGVNTSLRHRCALLVRRHCGPRGPQIVSPRLGLSVRSHNDACEKRWQKRQFKTTPPGE